MLHLLVEPKNRQFDSNLALVCNYLQKILKLKIPHYHGITFSVRLAVLPQQDRLRQITYKAI